jgi:hypothetical protein
LVVFLLHGVQSFLSSFYKIPEGGRKVPLFSLAAAVRTERGIPWPALEAGSWISGHQSDADIGETRP